MNNLHPAMIHTIRVNYMQMAIRQETPDDIMAVLHAQGTVIWLEAAGRYRDFKITGIEPADERLFTVANQMADANPLFNNK